MTWLVSFWGILVTAVAAGSMLDWSVALEWATDLALLIRSSTLVSFALPKMSLVLSSQA